MKRTWAVGVGILLILCCLLIWSSERSLLVESAKRGMQWFAAYDADYGNVGVFWALSATNDRYCKDDAFEQELRKRFEAYPRTQIERAYFYFTRTGEETFSGTSQVYDRWLSAALSCREEPVPSALAKEIQDVATATGYDLTHKYMALSYLAVLGCASAEDAEARSLAASAMILQESEDTHFTDLFAERAALLLWGGERRAIRSEWMRRIANAQTPSGGWADAGLSQEPNTHTSALAVWALAQYTGSCPLR